MGQARWLFDTLQAGPSLADLAGWVSITRRRSYRPSPLNKYRKYAPAPVNDGETPGETSGETSGDQPQEGVEDDNFETISVGDGSEVEAPQEMKLKERLSNAVELDVLAEDFDWGNLLSVHKTEHAQSEEDESSDGRDSIGSVEVCIWHSICTLHLRLCVVHVFIFFLSLLYIIFLYICKKSMYNKDSSNHSREDFFNGSGRHPLVKIVECSMVFQKDSSEC